MSTKGQQLNPGQRIGELTLLMRVRKGTTGTFALRKKWRCECTCGMRVTVPEQYFLRPQPKQHCGARVHIETFNSKYKEERGIWTMMRERCYNPNHVGFKHYGGRGIRVCDEWLNDPDGFKNFLNFVGPRPSKNHTIDRVDPDGWYQPYQADGKTVQVKWATWIEQNNNKREHKYARQQRQQPGK